MAGVEGIEALGPEADELLGLLAGWPAPLEEDDEGLLGDGEGIDPEVLGLELG